MILFAGYLFKMKKYTPLVFSFLLFSPFFFLAYQKVKEKKIYGIKWRAKWMCKWSETVINVFLGGALKMNNENLERRKNLLLHSWKKSNLFRIFCCKKKKTSFLTRWNFYYKIFWSSFLVTHTYLMIFACLLHWQYLFLWYAKAIRLLVPWNSPWNGDSKYKHWLFVTHSRYANYVFMIGGIAHLN